MNKVEKSAGDVKHKSGAQQTQQEPTKTVRSPKIVTGTEIPNLLKNRPFKIRYY